MATCENYKILKKLGTGGFADVFLAKNKTDGSMVALKIIVKNSDYDQDFEDFICAEISAMKNLHHPNILNLVDHNINAIYKKASGESYEVLYMALELANGGDLFDYVLQTSAFSEDMVRYYCHQLIDAFGYMNQQGISHRDMKPENLLFDSDFNIKIADFGWASSKARNSTRAGTIQYMAPEIHIEDDYSPLAADIFSLGIILFTMVARHPPFTKPDPKEDKHFNAICANRSDLFWKWHTKAKAGGLDYFSESFRELITSMLQLDPLTRPTLAEIKSHEWFNKPIPSK
jgi:serine/threonine protein kinase